MSGVAQNVVLSRALGAGGLRDLYLMAVQEAADAASATDRSDDVRARLGPSDRGARPTPEVRGPCRTWMQREIGYEYHQIRDAALADPFKATSNEGFDAAVQELLTFARKRPDFVAGEIAKERARRGTKAISR